MISGKKCTFLCFTCKQNSHFSTKILRDAQPFCGKFLRSGKINHLRGKRADISLENLGLNLRIATQETRVLGWGEGGEQ